MRTGRLSRLWPGRRNREAATCLRCETKLREVEPGDRFRRLQRAVFAEGHLTVAEVFGAGEIAAVGVCALCVECHDELEPSERLPFYREKWLEFAPSNEPERNRLIWVGIEAAVRSGG